MNISIKNEENLESKNEFNLQDQLEHLSHEFDCLGLPSINIHVNVLEQLVTSIHNLIRLYRRILSQNHEMSLHQTILSNDNLSQKKALNSYHNELKDKESELKQYLEIIRQKCCDIDQVKCEKFAVSKDLDAMKNLYNSKEKEHLHTITKLKLENLQLREKLGMEVGTYKPQDTKLIEVLTKYKAKEAIYEDTIKKLHENNKYLLNEVLNLKEEVLMVLCNKTVQ